MKSHVNRQEETNSRFSQLRECAQKQIRLTENKEMKSLVFYEELNLSWGRKESVIRQNKRKKRYTMIQTGSMEILRSERRN
jgi:hypothetical protein